MLVGNGRAKTRTARASPLRDRRRKIPQLHVNAEVGNSLIPFLRDALLRAIVLLPAAETLQEVSIALVSDGRMGELHRQFLGIAGPTDVLTFELEHTPAGAVSAGEIVICVPFARRTAKALGTRAHMEVLLYAIHGLLHLCGYDDRTRRGFQRMHRTEDELLRRLGFDPVFRPGAPTSKRTHRRKGSRR